MIKEGDAEFDNILKDLSQKEIKFIHNPNCRGWSWRDILGYGQGGANGLRIHKIELVDYGGENENETWRLSWENKYSTNPSIAIDI